MGVFSVNSCTYITEQVPWRSSEGQATFYGSHMTENKAILLTLRLYGVVVFNSSLSQKGSVGFVKVHLGSCSQIARSLKCLLSSCSVERYFRKRYIWLSYWSLLISTGEWGIKWKCPCFLLAGLQKWKTNSVLPTHNKTHL